MLLGQLAMAEVGFKPTEKTKVVMLLMGYHQPKFLFIIFSLQKNTIDGAFIDPHPRKGSYILILRMFDQARVLNWILLALKP